MQADWQAIIKRATELRHRLHRRPEIAWSEFETAKTIRDLLDELTIPWRACADTGTVACLAPNAPGRHIALRADIDALPISECSGVPWQSENEGFMHACGHDGHTATLFAALWWLRAHEDQLPGPVTLLFQPAEEGGHGARRMVDEGALEGVEAVFGWHNWPAIPAGKAVCPDGAVMAANGTFQVELRGRGGHASQPELCRDPVLAAAAVAQALQQIVSRRLAAQSAAVVSVTSIDARSAETVIPDTARLAGSIRLQSSDMREQVENLIREIAVAQASAYGVTAEVKVIPRYGATTNHTNEAAEMRTALSNVLGNDWQCEKTAVPIMASEDFSYYLNAVPGAFALIGAGDGISGDYPCHNPHYDFRDALIPDVARVFLHLAGAPMPTVNR
ncbi:hippurate hydrolase [Litorivivens lipolytica]|uniref:Hippurate hydrolase n=1 Tax=Litorivivens lipolytica TaxID=1524264 RepID=A0A7W4W5Y3_9GAMM|nr:N(2)-acetyl-L-2,4-diaminobutanoate deacetylase DoeB2 [Litorivivens lipolytica]MBB3048081.1 hippurate hydrolase [Litorivivens lipolytica]